MFNLSPPGREEAKAKAKSEPEHFPKIFLMFLLAVNGVECMPETAKTAPTLE